MCSSVLLAVTLSIAMALSPQNPRPERPSPPKRVSVLPVFFVPTDAPAPTDTQKAALSKHVEWTQRRYRELLRGTTFRIAPGGVRVHQAPNPGTYYEALPEGGAPQYVAELLDEYRLSRAACPYVFVVVFLSPDHDFPGGGGRPINGGNNEGGGVVILSSHALDTAPNFQSTLQHELGHAFGLPHVDVYGYSMTDNPSLMSYNPGHHTEGFTPSSHPGAFIPEDLRALALNQRAFPGLTFDPTRDVPAGYALHPKLVRLGPMNIPGRPYTPGPR